MSYQGFGLNTTGGEGGQTIHVTNLNNAGTGSLREAVMTSGPRTIVFDVGGTIELEPWGGTWPATRAWLYAADGNLTIAGETAPPPGITIKFRTDQWPPDLSPYGAVMIFGYVGPVSNIILSHLAFRPNIWPYVPGEVEPLWNQLDTMFILSFGNSQTAGTAVNNVVIDHCSFSHQVSRCISVSDSCSDWTISNCIFGPGLLPTANRPWLNHSKGFSNHQGSTRMSLINNIWAHQEIRMPQINGVFDVRGNIIYDWADFGAYIQNVGQPIFPNYDKDVQVNWVGNTIIFANNGRGAEYEGLIAADWRNNPESNGTGSLQFYIDDVTQLRHNGGANQSTVQRYNTTTQQTELIPYVGSEYQATVPFSMPGVTTLSKQEVLAQAGRSPRDAIDAALISEPAFGFIPPSAPTEEEWHPQRRTRPGRRKLPVRGMMQGSVLPRRR